MQSFNDRFILRYPTLASVDLDQIADPQLEILAPDAKVFASMVRGYSVIIRRKTTKEIYNIVTQQVDPRISLILASARDKAGARLFPNLDVVKALMFGPNDTSQDYLDSDLNIFVEGIKRVAAALTASILIGQLAQIDEQAKHSIILEKQAIDDLDRLVNIPDLAVALESSTVSTKVIDDLAFYFEKKEITLTSGSLKVEIFMPSSITTGWNVAGTYTGTFTTSQIVADVSDSINAVTLINKTSNIIAAPVLAESPTLHKIDFLARERDVTISAEVIILKITYLNSVAEPIPFKWGISKLSLENQTINSLILTVQQGKTGAISGSSSTSTSGKLQPTVLYFRRLAVNTNEEVVDYNQNLIPKSIWAGASKLRFRISPNQTEAIEVDIPYLTSSTIQTTLDIDRPSQVAETLLNQMYLVKGATRALGALFRNDDPRGNTSYSAIELIAFSVTNPETWLILDVLEIPKDIEMAVGDLTAPLTSFSNKARSIRVESTYKSGVIAINTGGNTNAYSSQAIPKSVPLSSSNFIRQAMEKGKQYQWGINE